MLYITQPTKRYTSPVSNYNIGRNNRKMFFLNGDTSESKRQSNIGTPTLPERQLKRK